MDPYVPLTLERIRGGAGYRGALKQSGMISPAGLSSPGEPEEEI